MRIETNILFMTIAGVLLLAPLSLQQACGAKSANRIAAQGQAISPSLVRVAWRAGDLDDGAPRGRFAGYYWPGHGRLHQDQYGDSYYGSYCWNQYRHARATGGIVACPSFPEGNGS